MKNIDLSFKYLVFTVSMLFACGPENDEMQVAPLGGDPVRFHITETKQLERIKLITAGLAGKGIFNSLPVAGIAAAESNFSHCWSEATWSCKGPASTSCNNGPILAGASDGACYLKQGGLGMFQFDSGTYNDTINRYGNSILTVGGNAAAVIPFLAHKIINSPKTSASFGLSHIKNEADFVAWMNKIVVQNGNTAYEAWLKMVSCFYNGSCNGQKVAVYRARTNQLKVLYGTKFFDTAASSIAPENCREIKIVRTSGDWINLRSSINDGPIVGKAWEGDHFSVINHTLNGRLVADPAYPSFASKTWYEVSLKASTRAWVSAAFANCVK